MTKQLRPPTVQELASHVQEIASRFGVVLILVPTLEHHHAIASCGGEDRRTVVARPVTDETTYAIMLHELGHCIAPNGTIFGPQHSELILLQEHSAWDWARHYSLDWTVTMEHVAVQALESYEHQARQEKVMKDKMQQRSEEHMKRTAAALTSFFKRVLK